MDVSSAVQENTASVQQAISISLLQKATHQDQQSVASLLQGMQDTNAKIMENSVTPHKGSHIDVRL